MSTKQHAPYLVYVLRLWCDDPDTSWRAVLECARTGERLPFADLAALFAFLEAETGSVSPLSPSKYINDTEQDRKSQIEDGCIYPKEEST